MAVAAIAMLIGFWLKWRYLLQPDPIGWFLYSWGRMGYTDLVALYLQQGLDSHPVPYLQTHLEYPVLIGVAQYLVSMAPGPRGYFLAASGLLALAGLGCVWLLHRRAPQAPMWVFVATPPLLLYSTLNWDLLALFFALLSLDLFDRKRDGWSALAVTLGIWTKLFPVVVLVWMLLKRAVEKDWRSVARIAAVVGVTSALLNLPVLLAAPSGWAYFFAFQSSRPPDGGSLWSYLPGLSIEAVNMLSLAADAMVVMVMGTVAVRGNRGVEAFGIAALATVMLTSKSTSPQYDLWLMPFLALAAAPAWLVWLFSVVDVAYFWSSFQTVYLRFGGQSDLAGLFPLVDWVSNAAHQGVLLLLWIWAVGRLARQPVSPARLRPGDYHLP